MKVWGALFNLFAILVILMLSVSFVNMSKVLNRDFEQARLNQAVEYATEATFRSALSVEDLGMDYESDGMVSINPGNSLDTFTSLMAINYDMATTKENKQYIESSIASIVLTASDGFYITQTVQDDTTPNNNVRGGEYNLKWSPKLPYLYKVGNKSYSLNVDKQTWVSADTTGTLNLPTYLGYPLGLSHEDVLDSLNYQITKNIIYEIKQRNLNSAFEYNFFLPSETTKTGVNPIDGPSIILLLQGARFNSTERMSTVSVSGYKVTNKVNIVAFSEVVAGKTRKFYCYEGQMSPDDINGKYKIENYYNNTTEAANDGYSPHYGLLVKKIIRK